MREENLGVFSARHLILGEHEAIKPCTLFLRSTRIIVASPEGINRWTVVAVIVAFAASLTGLLLRNSALFVGGFGVGIMTGLLIAVIDFVMRHKRLSRMKGLDPERILEMHRENFEIRYAEIAKVEVEAFETYSRGSLFLPHLSERLYEIAFVTDEKKHTFILDGSNTERCLSLLRQLLPEKIETEQV